MSDRQQRMLRRVLENAEAEVTVKQWAKLSKVSVDTAQRDIDDLVRRKVLRRNAAGGPRTSYRFAWKPRRS